MAVQYTFSRRLSKRGPSPRTYQAQGARTPSSACGRPFYVKPRGRVVGRRHPMPLRFRTHPDGYHERDELLLTKAPFCEISLINIVQPKSACLPAGLTRGNQIPRLILGCIRVKA